MPNDSPSVFEKANRAHSSNINSIGSVALMMAEALEDGEILTWKLPLEQRGYGVGNFLNATQQRQNLVNDERHKATFEDDKECLETARYNIVIHDQTVLSDEWWAWGFEGCAIVWLVRYRSEDCDEGCRYSHWGSKRGWKAQLLRAAEGIMKVRKNLSVWIGFTCIRLIFNVGSQDRLINSVSLSPVESHERGDRIAFSSLDVDIDKFLAVLRLYVTRKLSISVSISAYRFYLRWVSAALDWRARCAPFVKMRHVQAKTMFDQRHVFSGRRKKGIGKSIWQKTPIFCCSPQGSLVDWKTYVSVVLPISTLQNTADSNLHLPSLLAVQLDETLKVKVQRRLLWDKKGLPRGTVGSASFFRFNSELNCLPISLKCFLIPAFSWNVKQGYGYARYQWTSTPVREVFSSIKGIISSVACSRSYPPPFHSPSISARISLVPTKSRYHRHHHLLGVFHPLPQRTLWLTCRRHGLVFLMWIVVLIIVHLDNVRGQIMKMNRG